MLVDPASSLTDSNKAVAEAIHKMAFGAEDSVILANVIASCFECTRIFGKYSR
jgi:hypothetical protein